MTSLEALVREVVGRPRDDEVREAYAAAVEDADPRRAELIRLQLEMARKRRAGLDDQEHAPRVSELLAADGPRWAQPIAQHVSDYWFVRGFVEVITLDARRFLDSAPELYDLAPILHLNLTDAGQAEALFRSEWLDRIVSISLVMSGLGDAEAVQIAQSPYLRSLEWLDLSSNNIGAVGFEALAASENLPLLGFLDFNYNAIVDPTPHFADEYSCPSPTAAALQERHGHREWLDPHPRWLWPPERDAVHPVFG